MYKLLLVFVPFVKVEEGLRKHDNDIAELKAGLAREINEMKQALTNVTNIFKSRFGGL